MILADDLYPIWMDKFPLPVSAKFKMGVHVACIYDIGRWPEWKLYWIYLRRVWFCFSLMWSQSYEILTKTRRWVKLIDAVFFGERAKFSFGKFECGCELPPPHENLQRLKYNTFVDATILCYVILLNKDCPLTIIWVQWMQSVCYLVNFFFLKRGKL